MFNNYKFDDKDPTGRHSFEIYDIDLAIVNSIRRSILSDIEIPGIIGEEEPTVQIIKSNGPLHNEILIHRIGLIPICLKESEIDNYIDNSIELELNIENNTLNTINVTTEHITGKRNDIDITQKELNEIFYKNIVSNDNILITRLRPNEYLHFKAKVVKKNGKYNASFNPVSLANFSFIIDKSKINKDTNILDKERSYFTNKEGDPNAILFEIEPVNKYLKPKYLINKAIESLINKLNKLISDIKSDNVLIEKYNDLESTYEFTIENEDDTLGNLIQSFIHDKFVRKKEKIQDNVECLYCGYICVHPLKNLLKIRLTLNQTIPNKFNEFLEYNCFSIIDNLQNIKNDWNIFMEKK
tara:strand:+ start:4285 stop:5349 length:1065 start_codon:yes stop_codon:yes gene_type:complete